MLRLLREMEKRDLEERKKDYDENLLYNFDDKNVANLASPRTLMISMSQRLALLVELQAVKRPSWTIIETC